MGANKVNSERNILKETVDNIITKLNNYLMVADLKQRYVLNGKKEKDKLLMNKVKFLFHIIILYH